MVEVDTDTANDKIKDKQSEQSSSSIEHKVPNNYQEVCSALYNMTLLKYYLRLLIYYIKYLCSTQAQENTYETINLAQEVEEDDKTDTELKDFNAKDSLKIHSKSIAKKSTKGTNAISANQSQQIGQNEPEHSEVFPKRYS